MPIAQPCSVATRPGYSRFRRSVPKVIPMKMRTRPPTVLLLAALLAPATLLSCTSQTSGSPEDILSAEATPPQEKGGEEEFGPYEPVENWPLPLVDHEGWTWGRPRSVCRDPGQNLDFAAR